LHYGFRLTFMGNRYLNDGNLFEEGGKNPANWQ
jgi:hypothetical protein